MIKGTINAEGGVSYNGANMRFAWNGTTVTATPSEGATVVFAGRADATNVDLYINGGLAAGPTASGAAVGSTSSVVCVGGYGADAVNYYTNCVFSEFIFYGSRLSDANRNIVEKYLGRQNAIAVS